MMHITFYYWSDNGEIRSVREVNCIPVVGDIVYFSLVEGDKASLKGKFIVSGREFCFEGGGMKTTVILTRR